MLDVLLLINEVSRSLLVTVDRAAPASNFTGWHLDRVAPLLTSNSNEPDLTSASTARKLELTHSFKSLTWNPD